MATTASAAQTSDRVSIHECVVIVRAAGERTESSAITILRAQVDALGGRADRQVLVVRERPFARAVQATYEQALASGAAWAIAIDADVILLPDGLDRLLHACALRTPDAFTITPLVLCRFFHGFCFRGVHLYPVHLLDKALGVMDQCGARHSVRPETAVVTAMQPLGYRIQATTSPVGVHDDEQWFRHIYLKMRLRGRREIADDAGRSLQTYVDLLEGLARGGDDDARVAVWGLLDGAADARRPDPPPPQYDWMGAYPEFDTRMRDADLREKLPLDRPLSSTHALDRMLEFDYALDTRTPQWIRTIGGFARGPAEARARFCLQRPVSADPMLVPRAEHRQRHDALRT